MYSGPGEWHLHTADLVIGRELGRGNFGYYACARARTGVRTHARIYTHIHKHSLAARVGIPQAHITLCQQCRSASSLARDALRRENFVQGSQQEERGAVCQGIGCDATTSSSERCAIFRVRDSPATCHCDGTVSKPKCRRWGRNADCQP